MGDIFTQTGEELFADIIDNTVAVPTYHGGMGTGAGAAAKGDTTLTTEVETRDVSTVSQPAADQLRWVSTIAATAARAIIEIGLFSLITGGIMFFRSDITVINLANGDSLESTVTFTLA